MFEDFKAEWRELERAEPGERFARYHERYQAREAPCLKALLFFSTVFCVGMSVVLPISSESTGPALLFALFSAALLPGESRWVARTYDRIERLLRRRAERVRQPVPPLSDATSLGAEAAPVMHSNLRTTPIVRARVVPPRIAGTLKIWTSEVPAQPSDAPKMTIALFPPPAEPSVEASEPPHRRVTH